MEKQITESLTNKIYSIRGKRVMLDRDLAELYGVGTKVFNQAVTRNMDRFPDEFLFQLTDQEVTVLRSQFVTANELNISSKSRYLPRVFTEYGVAMLSGILKSDRAIQVNISIIRAFVDLRKMIADNKELREKIDQMEEKYDKQFQEVFYAIRQLIDTTPTVGIKRKIGF